jgi:radical SAM superfamily enzyme YgiQ (UPF0313 family)
MTPVVHGAMEAARIAKNYGSVVVMGGPHLSALPQETLAFPEIDFGIIGEGEDTFVVLCRALESRESIKGLEGLVYRKDGKVVVEKAGIVADINALDMPAYHLMPMQKYSSIIGLHPTATMIAVRGCPFRCGYCFKTPSDKKIRVRDLDLVVDEMAFLVKKYGIKEIMFYNDFMPTQYMTGLAEKILARGLTVSWESPQRVDMVDPDMYPLLKRSGCRMLRFGVEQGNPEQLSRLNKGITPDQVKAAFAAAQKAKIKTFAYFIIGYHAETDATMQETINFAKELDPAYVMFTKAVPMPSTPLMDDVVKDKIVPADYWHKFALSPAIEPIPGLVPDADIWVKRAYRAFYLRPGKIFEHIKYINNWGDIKKAIDAGLGILFFRSH